jgi:hypothetical protein
VFRLAAFILTPYFFGLWVTKEAYRQWHETRADMARVRAFHAPHQETRQVSEPVRHKPAAAPRPLASPKPVASKKVVTTDPTRDAKQPAILNDFPNPAFMYTALKENDYANYLEYLNVDDAKKN